MSQAASVRCIDINAHGADSTVAPGWGKFVYWFAAALALLFATVAWFAAAMAGYFVAWFR